MVEPTEAELHRIARCLLDEAQRLPPRTDGSGRLPDGWALTAARAAWSLGARHDGRGELHGPVVDLGRGRNDKET